MPITPITGSFLHADPHAGAERLAAQLLLLLLARWVLAHRQLLSCPFPASTGLGQTDFWIGAQTKLLLSAIDARLLSPELAITRIDLGEKAPTLGAPHWLTRERPQFPWLRPDCHDRR
jgi:hypothetical protein